MPSRLGEPSGFGSLYTYLVAPAWWLDPTDAWEAAKLIGVLVMTAAIFPAYGLARFVVSRPWAIAAAIGAVAAPPLAYAPYLLEEPLAYPFSTTALWAITAAIARPTWRRLALAGALCLVAPFVRGELAVLLVVYCAGLFVLLWRTDRFTRWRTDWSAGDWVGAVTLASGAALAVSAAAGHRSDAWYVATGFEKHRVLDHGLWSLARDDDRPRRAAGGRDGRGLRVPPGSRHHRGPRVRHRRHLGVSSRSSRTPRSRARTSRRSSRC